MGIPDWILVIIMSTSGAKYMDYIPMQDQRACEYAAKRLNDQFAISWGNERAICIATKTPSKVEK